MKNKSYLKYSYLKKVWCSTQTFHSLLAARWFGSLKPIVLSNCSNCNTKKMLSFLHLFRFNRLDTKMFRVLFIFKHAALWCPVIFALDLNINNSSISKFSVPLQYFIFLTWKAANSAEQTQIMKDIFDSQTVLNYELQLKDISFVLSLNHSFHLNIKRNSVFSV